MNRILILLLLTIIVTGCGGGRKQPLPAQVSEPLADNKVTYNVYVENSASMDGYANGVTEFKDALGSFISDISITNLSDTMNFYFANNQAVKYGNDVSLFIKAIDLPNFIAFRKKGKDTGTTDISNLLKNVLANSTDNNVSLLISDFIFSPGRNKNAAQYLNEQRDNIKIDMAKHLKQFPNHAVVIYQLESKFNGTFFNKLDNPSRFVGNRPYYIWIIGERDLLSNLTRICPIEKFKGGGVKNIFSITKEGLPVKYAVRYGSGNFKLDKKDPHKSIVDAQKDTKGVGEKKLRFNLNVDLSNLLLDDSYLLDRANYDISDKDYQLEIQKNNSANGYSHTLKFTTLIVKPTNVTIRIKSQVPLWVDEVNDDIGMDINLALDKTYGFKYLVDGIYEAFTKDGAYCAEMKVKINQK